MRKIFSMVIILLTVVLYLLMNFMGAGNIFNSGAANIVTGIGHLLYVLVVALALIYTIINKKYILGLILSALKITIPYGSSFIRNLLSGNSLNFKQNSVVFGMFFAIISLIIIGFIIFELSQSPKLNLSLKLEHFVGPMLVLLFLLLFSSYENAIISSLSEMVSFMVLAYLTAEFLFVSVFITVPFHLVATLIEYESITFDMSFVGNVLYWITGILLLVYGIKSLAKELKSSHQTA